MYGIRPDDKRPEAAAFLGLMADQERNLRGIARGIADDARYFWRMDFKLSEAPPSPAWPEGIEVQPLVASEGERRFYATLEEAFSDHWGNVPVSFASGKKRRMRHGFDPGIWFLAVADGKPTGAAISSISEGVGCANSLGVRRPWRKCGLGLALLQHAVGEFHRRGLRRVALGVDSASPTGTTRLYERAGLTVAQQHATYAKKLRRGIDLTDADDEE